jgi:membrane-associated phospholipid phosphatase
LNEMTQPRLWFQQVAVVIPKYWYLKAMGTVLFISIFFGAYFYLLKYPAFPITVIPLTWMDGLVSFQPRALPVYLSLWVYISLPPIFFALRRELYLYGLAIALMSIAGLAIFYFWPTTIPAANIDWTRYPDVDFLKNIDASGNACPSLHVATAIFSGIWLHHLLRRFSVPWGLLLFNWLWCIGIVYSTLATRQHVALDVWGGLVLGGVAAYLSLPRTPGAVGIAPSLEALR